MSTPASNTLRPATPWYREPWPWLLMAGPFIVVIAGIITTWLAIDSNDGLVEDDYYKQGLAVGQRMERDTEAGVRQLYARGSMLADSLAIEVNVSQRDAAPSLPPLLNLQVVHPTRAGSDQDIPLAHQGGGLYRGTLARPLQGRWHVQLEDPDRHWRLTGEWRTAAPAAPAAPLTVFELQARAVVSPAAAPAAAAAAAGKS